MSHKSALVLLPLMLFWRAKPRIGEAVDLVGLEIAQTHLAERNKCHWDCRSAWRDGEIGLDRCFVAMLAEVQEVRQRTFTDKRSRDKVRRRACVIGPEGLLVRTPNASRHKRHARRRRAN